MESGIYDCIVCSSSGDAIAYCMTILSRSKRSLLFPIPASRLINLRTHTAPPLLIATRRYDKFVSFKAFTAFSDTRAFNQPPDEYIAAPSSNPKAFMASEKCVNHVLNLGDCTVSDPANKYSRVKVPVSSPPVTNTCDYNIFSANKSTGAVSKH